MWTTLGVAVFLPGYLFFLRAAVQNWQPGNRHLALGAALVYLGVLFIVRTFMATSEPTFSEGACSTLTPNQ